MRRVSNIVLTEAEKLKNGWPIIAAGRQIGTKQSSQRQLQVLVLDPEPECMLWKNVYHTAGLLNVKCDKMRCSMECEHLVAFYSRGELRGNMQAADFTDFALQLACRPCACSQ